MVREPVEEEFCDAIAQKASHHDVCGKMDTQVDARPPDEGSSEIEHDPIPREPGGEKGGHHERIHGMAAGKTEIEYLS